MEKDDHKLGLFDQGLFTPETVRWAIRTGHTSPDLVFKKLGARYSKEVICRSLPLFDFIGPKELKNHYNYGKGSFFKLSEVPEISWSLDELQKILMRFGNYRAIMWLALPKIDGAYATPRNIIDRYNHLYDHLVDISRPELCYDKWLDTPVVTNPTWKLSFIHPEPFDQFDIDMLVNGMRRDQSLTFSQSDAGSELFISLIEMHRYGRGYRNHINFDTRTCGLKGFVSLSFDGSVHIGCDEAELPMANMSFEFN